MENKPLTQKEEREIRLRSVELALQDNQRTLSSITSGVEESKKPLVIRADEIYKYLTQGELPKEG